MGTGTKQKPGTKLWKRWAAVRMGALLLTVCLLAGSIPANGLTAAAAAVLEKEDAAAYEIYLADFLSQEPRLGSDLSLDMLHRRLNTAMDEESGFRESADAYLFLTDGGSLVFNSRQELYKQILLEILCRQAASGDTLEKARESCGTWRDTILEYAAMALDYGPDVLGSEGALRQMLASASVAELQNAFLASTVYGVVQEQGKTGSLEGILQDLGLNGRANREALEACLTKIDDAAYASGRTLRRAVEQTAGEFRLSGGGGSAASGAGSAFSSETASGIGLCVNLLLSTTQNMLEYTEKLAMYMALSEHREGTLEFLELMYRQTDDPSLMAAIRSVSDGIRAVSSGDVAQLAAELRYGTSLKMVSDILLNLVQQWAGAAGLLTGGTAILTDLLFRSGEIAELSRLLDAQIAVEDAVRAGLRYMINAYSGTYQQAVTLNTGAYMLYDTYEYGMELAVAYAEAVMDDAWISRIGNKLLEFFRRGVYGSRYVPREGSYSFKELAKAYEALITTGRSAFDSARLMYEEEHPGPSVSADIWENPPVFVTGIFMEKDPLILPLSGGENQAYFASASAVPANADNRRIRYESSDTAVVMTDEFGQLTPVAPGSAWITASTEEGQFTARRQVIVVLGQETADPSANLRLEDVPEEYYQENGDGVTLRKPVAVDLEGGGEAASYGENPVLWEDFNYRKERAVTSVPSHASCLVIPAYVNGHPVTELDFRESHQEQPAGALGEPRYWESYGSLPEGYAGQYALVIPDTVKRIADGCFERCQFMGGIRLGSQVESIGERAFADAQFLGAVAEAPEEEYKLASNSGEEAPVPAPTGTIVLPESIRSLGESAFEGADFYGSSLVVQADVETIPARCFAEVKDLDGGSILSPNLKRIEERAFYALTADTKTAAVASGQRAIVIPDTVESIGKEAFYNSEPGIHTAVQALPESLNELGEGAFSGVRLEDASFPAGLQEIPAGAFSGVQFEMGEAAVRLPDGLRKIGEEAFQGAEMTQVQLPDSLEEIGACAFEHCTAETVECFETEAPVPQKGKIQEYAFAGCQSLTSAQLPAGITEMGADIYLGCTALQNLAWPAGLYSLEPQTFSSEGGLYITLRGEAQAGEKGKLPDEALVCEPGCSIVYLELPGAFAGQLNLGAFRRMSERYYDLNHLAFDNSRRIQTLFVQGVVEETAPGEMVKDFADCIQKAVYALDADGNRICLYQRQPDSYTKVSRYCSEDSEAFQIEFPQESQLLTEQIFGEAITRSVRLNADGETAAALAGADIAVYSWYSEGEKTRALELEEFLEFEDLYLRQPNFQYYRIGVTVDGEERFSYPGSYQVIFDLPPEWDGSATAVYHIDKSGLITRLSGDFYNDGTTKEFRALSSDIGSFAVASMTHLSEEVQVSFSEERHQLLEAAHREAGEDPLEFPMEGGIISIVRPAEEESAEPEGSEAEENVSGTEDAEQAETAEESTEETGETGKVTVFRPAAEEEPAASEGDGTEGSVSETGEKQRSETEVLEIESTGKHIRLEIGLTDLEGRIPILSKKTDGSDRETGSGLLSFLPGGDKQQVETSLIRRSGESEEGSGGTVWYEAVLEDPGQYQLRLEESRGWIAWFSELPLPIKIGSALVALWILKKLLGGRKKKRAKARKAN